MQILNAIGFYISSLLITVIPTSTYSEGIVGQPRSFFPHQTVTQHDKTISSLIYRGLFKYDIYGELIPDLAESWEIKQDGIVYIVKLKENQKWSDGTAITADDLIYTSFQLPELRDVATDKIDDRTVLFTLPNKYSPFLNLLTVGIMKSNSEEKYNGLIPVSSGPFTVLKIKRTGPVIKEIILKNTSENAKFKNIVFKYYTNEDQLVTGAKLGEFDGFLGQSDVELENFEDYQFPLQGVYYGLFFNLREEKMQDVELRSKMNKVLDKVKLTSGYGIPVQGAISRNLYTDSSLDFNSYDPDFSEVQFEDPIVLTIPDLPKHVELASTLKDIWEDKLGLEIEINRVNPNDLFSQVIKDRKFEMLLYGQETSRDPDRYANWHSTQIVDPGLNLSGLVHVRADRALEEGRNLNAQRERKIHYNEFQKVINEQVPVIFLYHPYTKYYVSKYIQGFGEKYTFGLEDRFIDFDNWSRIQTN